MNNHYLKILLLTSLTYLSVAHRKPSQNKLTAVHGDKFYYFGYGSNMLTKRIQLQNPTAVKISKGVLKNYRLDFNGYSTRWGGAPATVVETENEEVHGTVWEIDLSNLEDIDNQEGVKNGIYAPVSVPIVLPDDTELTARAYLLQDQPKTILKNLERYEIPPQRQPSKTYLKCLVKGAIETGIDAAYIQWLRSIKHNGHVANDFESTLELQDVQLPAEEVH